MMSLWIGQIVEKFRCYDICNTVKCFLGAFEKSGKEFKYGWNYVFLTSLKGSNKAVLQKRRVE